MKRSSLSYLISAGALLAALAPAASHAQAAWDGQIRFTGSVSDTTCSVNGGQGSASNITDVRLGNVDPNAATKALAVGANIGSKQTFKISLSNCSLLTPLPTNPASGTAQTETRGAAIEFDQGSANINGATGNLMVTGFQPAKGIEIGIWNAGNGKTNKLDLRGTMFPSDVQTLQLRFSNDSAVTQILAGDLTFEAGYVRASGTLESGNAGSQIAYKVSYR